MKTFRMAITLVVCLCAFAGLSSAFAMENSQDSINPKVKVVLLYGFVGSEGSDATKIYGSVFQGLKSRFAATFTDTYEFVDGDIYINQMAQKGIHDFLFLEKECIVNEFKNENINYVVVWTVLPGIGNKHVIHLKVIDIVNNQYRYVGSYSRSDFFASIQGIFNQIYYDIEREVFLKLFPQIKLTRQ